MPGRTLFLIVPFQLFPQPCRCLFFTPAHFPHWGQGCPRGLLFQGSCFSFPGFASIAKVLSSLSSGDPDLCRTYRHVPEERCTDFAPPQNFCVVQHVFRHLFHFLFFPIKKSFEIVPKLIPVPFLFLFICSCTFKHCIQVSFSFRTLLAVLGPRDSLFFHECIERFIFCTNLFPLSFWFRVLPGVYRALSPAASRRLLLPGFRGAIPPSVFQFVIFVCNGTIQNCSCLIKIGKSLSFVG